MPESVFLLGVFVTGTDPGSSLYAQESEQLSLLCEFPVGPSTTGTQPGPAVNLGPL